MSKQLVLKTSKSKGANSTASSILTPAQRMFGINKVLEVAETKGFAILKDSNPIIG